MFHWKLAIRYFFRRPMSWLASAAVALCAFIVMVVMTVMGGLVDEFRQKNHRYVGDCVVSSSSLVGFGYYEEFIETLRRQSFVRAVSPVVRQVGLAQTDRSGLTIGAQIVGIDPLLHSQATGFAQSLLAPCEDIRALFEPAEPSGKPGAVAGADVPPYYFFDMPADLERHFQIELTSFPLTTAGTLARTGTDLVSQMGFVLRNISQSGIVRVDASHIYISLPLAQKLCGMDAPIPRINEISIRFDGSLPLEQAVERVRSLWQAHYQATASLPGGLLGQAVRVESWLQHRRSAIAPLEKEQLLMMMLFMMLAVITVFIVFVVLYMIVSYAAKDIGILRSVGVSSPAIALVFELFALMVGLVGGSAGLAGGAFFLHRINALEQWLYAHFGWQLWDRTIYAIGDIPSQIEPALVWRLFAAALVACLIGGLAPSINAARKKPVETLQVAQI